MASQSSKQPPVSASGDASVLATTAPTKLEDHTTPSLFTRVRHKLYKHTTAYRKKKESELKAAKDEAQHLREQMDLIKSDREHQQLIQLCKKWEMNAKGHKEDAEFLSRELDRFRSSDSEMQNRSLGLTQSLLSATEETSQLRNRLASSEHFCKQLETRLQERDVDADKVKQSYINLLKQNDTLMESIKEHSRMLQQRLDKALDDSASWRLRCMSQQETTVAEDNKQLASGLQKELVCLRSQYETTKKMLDDARHNSELAEQRHKLLRSADAKELAAKEKRISELTKENQRLHQSQF